MANDKNKVVDNYCLEELRQVYPNQIQIWNVRHKILKKVFTLKKLKYRLVTATTQPNQLSPTTQSNEQYDKLVNQTNLLKRLNQEFAPKCYKMIKTSNNVYLVYQQFPSFTLKQYLTKNPLNAFQRNKLLEKLTLAVMQTHNKQIAILSLNPNNIYIKDKMQVFFGDWTLSQSIGNIQKITLSNSDANSQFIAKEVNQQGPYGLWSDIYSLGKIFKTIQNSCALQPNSSITKKLQTLITKMTSTNYQQRPTIKQVVNTLSGMFCYMQSNKPNTPHLTQLQKDYKIKSNIKVRHAGTMEQQPVQEMGISHLKSIKSVEMLLSQKDLDSIKSNHYDILQTPKGGTSKYLPKTDLLNTKNLSIDTASYFSMKKPSSTLNEYISLPPNRTSRNSERSSQTNERIFKIINKRRNLSFLLLDLSEFVLRAQSSSELGYMLLKYSFLIYRQNIQKWKNQKNLTSQGKHFTEILEKQILVIQHLLMKAKQQLKDQAKLNISLKKEIDNDHLINDKYMRQKILQFAKEIVINCEKNLIQKIFSMNLIDVLFKTYLILKKVEEGSYQKFWDKTSNEDNAYLSNQKYLKDQKSLGFRYLKSRIAEIMSKK